MKNNIFLYLMLTCLTLFSSCSEDIMDRINENVDNSTNMASKFIITDVMTSTAFRTVGTDLAFYASIYIEHNVGIYGQMYNAEIRQSEPTSSSTYNNAWESTYTNLFNLKDIIAKCSEGGSEEGNYHTLGIAQILTAYNLAILTDAFGDIPWSEALQPGIIYSPKLDTQEEIYDDIFALLNDAISNLEKTSEFDALGTQDLIYGTTDDGTIDANSIVKWKKFANGLLARYTLRLSKINPQYQAVIDYANKSFTNSAEEAKFKYNNSTSFSPFSRFLKDRDYFGASESFIQKLDEREDPRKEIFYGDEELVIAPNGTPDQKQGVYTKSQISIPTAPTYFLSYHEIEFLKAEAYARLNNLDNAQESLRKAIIAASSKSNINLAGDDSGQYAEQIIEERGSSLSSILAEIMIQKYIGFYEEEAFEAYNDFRRLKANGENFITLNNPKNANQFPLRYTYGSSDVTTNTNIADIIGDGTYVYSKNVWWAGGSN
ncbi:SusD/RagB family nutrient-binding outer membrane lipoprotein [uncultured Proteiniphilum sp.]|uniref:SusD/RagB family nutrient-binding outer membrane lipoprotein n=1 Tax=uncultured Proteiniphilum sp. TaxID=497637 RepID=UPI002607446C|nr:SusD/RagB family nutrient-binding outer membrane lipoprotein [uncultured Proteiniphilum sp.]